MTNQLEPTANQLSKEPGRTDGRPPPSPTDRQTFHYPNWQNKVREFFYAARSGMEAAEQSKAKLSNLLWQHANSCKSLFAKKAKTTFWVEQEKRDFWANLWAAAAEDTHTEKKKDPISDHTKPGRQKIFSIYSIQTLKRAPNWRFYTGVKLHRRAIFALLYIGCVGSGKKRFLKRKKFDAYEAEVEIEVNRSADVMIVKRCSLAYVLLQKCIPAKKELTPDFALCPFGAKNFI